VQNAEKFEYTDIHGRLLNRRGSWQHHVPSIKVCMYEGWNFNSGNYLFTTDTK